MRLSHRLSAVVLASATAFTACRRSVPEVPHVRLTSLDPVRAAFNADSGKVRAIFLASPT
jgi:hypothetical protein